MTRSDHREATGDQHRKRRLGPFQMKGHLEVAVCRYVREVVKSGFLKIEAELFGGRTQPQLPAALDVGSSKRFAVMPFDSVAQLEGQLGPVLAPHKAGRQIGH